ncbi:MAG: FAD-binding protein [Polyangiales bacterium]
MHETSRRDLLRWGLAAAATPWLGAGCRPCNGGTTFRWNNALHSDGIDPEVLADPASLPELVSLVRKAESEKRGIRMAGAGHSFSDVALSEDYMLRPWKLGALLTLDRAQLKAAHRDDPHLVRTESGIRLRHLNDALFAQGLALDNMGGWDAQTIVGAACTGTHGSGLAYGPIASQLVSLQLVTTGGEVLQLEPADGITDAAMFPGVIDTPAGRVPARLVQNDEVFNAVSVSMGCMGIVYAVVLRAVPRFWLREVRELTTWGSLTQPGGFLDRLLQRKQLDPGAAADPDHYEIYVNPYPPAAGGGAATHRCLLTRRYRLPSPPATFTADDQKRGRWGSDLIGTVAQVAGRGDALADFLNNHPQHAPKLLDDSLAALQDASYVDVSYRVFNLGPANLFRVLGVELAFDLSQTIAATERHFALAAELRTRGIVHSSPPSLRFVKSADALLAPMHGRDTTMLELGMLVNADGAEDLLLTHEKKLIAGLRARPHWGLDLKALQDFSEVRALYPTADRWLAVYKELNRHGTFNAELTDRLGISVPR